ncbi:hypothetical protein, partial [Proteus mirabilis]|uniref:hypothetical protein n=1 Tax=Proteus mirabilis TaxID=584 RepID=UPI001EEBC4E9
HLQHTTHKKHQNLILSRSGNESKMELSPGEGVASIGIKIPQGGSETTRFIMRARIIVFPDNQDVIFN